MSSIEARLEFDIVTHLKDWKAIAKGLCRGEVGVKLQDRADVFGETAADLLEELLENHHTFLLHASRFELHGQRLTLEFEWPTTTHEFVEDLIQWLKACGVQNISISGRDNSSD